MSNPWIDVSRPLREGMVHWPGDPPFATDYVSDLDRGDEATVSRLSLGAHAGTHMDAPRHYLRGGAGIDTMPPATGLGRARVIVIEDPRSIHPAELRRHRLRAGERILFKTRNSDRCWKTDDFVEDFVHISAGGARFLAQRRVQLVGIDYLSVGGFEADGVETHRALLEAGIWILEGLDLSSVTQGSYDMACLPLRLEGGDGAPARVLLRPLAQPGKGSS